MPAPAGASRGWGMITGANTNVRYRGILFHVQTEDSGRANPHIISHVYHGGTILGTHKTDYADQLEAEDLIGVVRGLIEKQHTSMLEKLNSGDFDEVIRERLGDGSKNGGSASANSVESKPDTEPEANAPKCEPDTATFSQPEASTPLRTLKKAGRGFGEGIGSELPLDEVILDYLSQKARARSGERTGSTAPKTRSRG
jgi:hypothetical protein